MSTCSRRIPLIPAETLDQVPPQYLNGEMQTWSTARCERRVLGFLTRGVCAFQMKDCCGCYLFTVLHICRILLYVLGIRQ